MVPGRSSLCLCFISFFLNILSIILLVNEKTIVNNKLLESTDCPLIDEIYGEFFELRSQPISRLSGKYRLLKYFQSQVLLFCPKYSHPM